MKMRLTCEQLEMLTDLCNDFNVEIRLDYSGRGMYSSECIGFSFYEDTNEYKFLMDLAEYLIENDEHELLNSMKRKICSDSMGRGTIIYFPNVKEPEQSEQDLEQLKQLDGSDVHPDSHNP